MHHLSTGVGKPLLLIHGLGGSWRSWTPVLAPLAAQRQVIAVDLPGFGETPPLPGEVSIATLADATCDFLAARRLIGKPMPDQPSNQRPPMASVTARQAS